MPTITDVPLEPIRQELQFNTGVAIGLTGKEHRVSTSGDRPRQAIRYRFETDEAGAALREAQQRGDLVDSIEVPLWHEAIAVDFEAPASDEMADSITGDFEKANEIFAAKDKIFFNGSATTITGISAAAISFSSQVPIGSEGTNRREGLIAPRVSLSRIGGGDVSYFIEDGGVVQIQGNLDAFDSLSNDIVPTFVDVFPILDMRSETRDSLRRRFQQSLEVSDFERGGIFKTRSDLPESRAVERLYYHAESGTDEWRRLKGFLNCVQGRAKEFLLPTFTRDLMLSSPVGSNRNLLLLPEKPSDLKEGQYLRLEFESRNSQIVQVQSSREVGGKFELTLTEEVDSNEVIDFISFVWRSRLASDTVVIQHFSSYSVVALTAISLVVDATPIAEPGGEFDSSFGEGFAI